MSDPAAFACKPIAWALAPIRVVLQQNRRAPIGAAEAIADIAQWALVASLLLFFPSTHYMETIMDRTLSTGTTPSYGGNNSPTSQATEKIESSAQAAHQTVDKVADKAATSVGRVSGAAHQAVNGAAGAATTAAQWASTIPEQATKLSESACASIRARPLSTVAGAVVVGYLLGRLARF